uniref:C-type lectin domain-containing protein n=1 Tax=Sinocyclocheilus grahami TaxID=75366 RepID=A0A672RUC9_SINGR
MVPALALEEWRFFIMEYGEQCVMMAGIYQTLQWCVERWATLAHILNAMAHEYITQMLQDKAITDGVWIGLERSMLFTCSPWLWTSGPYVKYASWHQEFPKHPVSMFCGKLLKEEQDRFGWMDACCHERLPFICQVTLFVGTNL